MSKINKIQDVKYSCVQMFELVNDVNSYSKFLPGCVSSKIISQEDNLVVARVDLARGPLKIFWVSKNTLESPKSIKMNYVDGSFKALEGEWLFIENSNGGCRVNFSLNYEFSSSIASLTLTPILSALTSNIISSFSKRALEIYG